MSATTLREAIIAQYGMVTAEGRVYRAPEAWSTAVASGYTAPKAMAECIANAISADGGSSSVWQEPVLSLWGPSCGLPMVPASGDRYLAVDTGNGWTADHVYEWNGTAWVDTPPRAGMMVWSDGLGERSVYLYSVDHWVEFGAGTAIEALNDLSDVTIATPTAGQVLSYSGQYWYNRTLSYSDVGAAASGHNHSGVYDPAGTGHSEAAAHVSAHESSYNHSFLHAESHNLDSHSDVSIDSPSQYQVLLYTTCSQFAYWYNSQLPHNYLGNIQPNDHHAQQHSLTGTDHPASGLTTGHFMKATGATTFAWQAHGLSYSDVGAAASGHNHDTAYAALGHNHDSAYSAVGHDHSGVYDPAGTAASALSGHTTSFNHSLLHAATTVTGNGISINGQQISLSIGTGSTQVAAGDHNHSGVYDPAGTSHSEASAHVSAHEVNFNHSLLHAAATVTGNGISINGQQISLSIGTGSTQVAAGNHGHTSLLAYLIHTGTQDGADNSAISIAGGGDAYSTRGAYIYAVGNEASSNAGILDLASGMASGARIRFIANNAVRGYMDDTVWYMSVPAQMARLGVGMAADASASLALATIPAYGSAASVFLTSNAGVVSSRTASQVLSDIGASASSHNHDSAYASASHTHDTRYARVDADSSVAGGILECVTPNGNSFGVNAGGLSRFQCKQNTYGADACMTFHIANQYAAYFGLDGSTNDFAVGGWSMGNVKYRVWHAGNDGTGSGLDADLWDGNQFSSYLNQSVKSDASPSFANVTVSTTLKTYECGLLDPSTVKYVYLRAPVGGISADRYVTINPGSADRTVNLTGSPTLSDWFDQSVKTSADPTFNNVVISTDVYRTAHTDWSSSASPSGWAATPTTRVYYKRIGKSVILWYYISGTSNASSCSITLPVACRTITQAPLFLLRCQDNTTWQGSPGWCGCSSNSTTLTFHKALSASNGWTSSGSKTVAGHIVYETD